jgi:hypothetical protein
MKQGSTSTIKIYHEAVMGYTMEQQGGSNRVYYGVYHGEGMEQYHGAGSHGQCRRGSSGQCRLAVMGNVVVERCQLVIPPDCQACCPLFILLSPINSIIIIIVITARVLNSSNCCLIFRLQIKHLPFLALIPIS